MELRKEEEGKIVRCDECHCLHVKNESPVRYAHTLCSGKAVTVICEFDGDVCLVCLGAACSQTATYYYRGADEYKTPDIGVQTWQESRP